MTTTDHFPHQHTDTQQGEDPMGDVLRFPSNHTQPTDATVHANAQRLDVAPEGIEVPSQEQRQIGHDPDTPITPETGGGVVQRAGRSGIPPALAGHARRVAGVTGRHVVRHGSYTVGGAWLLGGRAVGRLLHRDITEAIRQAKAARDYGMVAELERQRRESSNARWQRVLAQLKVAGFLSAAVPAGLILLNAVVFLYALIAELVPGGADFQSVWTAGFWAFECDAASFVGWMLSLWPWAFGMGVLAGGFVAWKTGRQAELTPAWAAAAAGKREVVNITPSIVVAALRELGIAPLRKAIETDPDAGAWMLGSITRYGPGAQVEITLPPQVTAARIMDYRQTLAGNLDRKAHEVYIERSQDSEREFTLWVADSGALDRPVPPSPLLAEDFGPVDLYRGAMPWGISPKGDAVELNLLQQHFLLAGLSKQGKTAAARALALWAALDPSVRLWIADLKGFGDWSMFDGLAETLIEGAGAPNFIDTCDMLEDAVAEMARRYDAWRARGRKGDIDRASAQPGSGFEPLIVIVDEVQKLYMCTTEHPDGGDIGGNGKKSRAARAAQALHDQARAVNIHLWQFAQNPTNQNLPAVVREGAMIRASLFVGTESIARMALGEAPVDTGAAPHALRAGLDRGTVVLAPGESMDLPNGATHTTVRTHYLSTEQSYDIAARAKALRAGIQRRMDKGVQRDLLEDVAEVYDPDEDKVKDTDLVARLRKLAGEHYTPYRKLTGTKLRDQLTDLGVRAKQRDGYWLIWSHDVHAARSDRPVSDT